MTLPFQRLRKFSQRPLIALLLLGLSGGFAQAEKVTIGSTNFSEQLILANIYATALRQSGTEVATRLNLGNREIMLPALQNGEIDIVPEYIGSLLSYYAPQTPATNSNQITQALQKTLPTGLTLLTPSAASSISTLAVTAATAQKYHLKKISDLTPIAGKLIIGGPPELKTRALGLPGYEKVYGIRFKQFTALDIAGPLTRLALNSGRIDVALVISTQGLLSKENWVVLEDDRHEQPAQNVTPLARKASLTPHIREVLDQVSAKLTNDDLRQLNQQVDIDHVAPEKAAAAWVAAHISKS
ncbi:L-proline glycine betaine binding ABC transporter protein ProX [Paramixta manurensis]|uniref:L-proline glycine betaine binding ABC transporter protein ProX n=1 Tax=Paramixta manurensis TaxID=2740817 RepID=A0A6M8U8W0_9GAMM|nr:L-proline glycine betaine binding ABC transporter protein ProX [Erwiniaceae bacterium PD-1]